MPTIMEHAQSKPLLSSVAAVAVSVSAIMGASNALQIDLIPWATATEVKKMIAEAQTDNKTILETLKAMQAKQQRIDASQRVILKAYWKDQLAEAIEELEANPTSRSAEKQRDEAKRELALIEAQEAANDSDR